MQCRNCLKGRGNSQPWVTERARVESLERLASSVKKHTNVLEWLAHAYYQCALSRSGLTRRPGQDPRRFKL